MQLDEWLTAHEAAKFLNVCRQRVGQLRKEGRITAEKRGMWLYEKQSVLAYKRNRRFKYQENKK